MAKVATLEKSVDLQPTDSVDESAEFVKLVKDLKAKIIDMKNQLKPLKEKIDKQEIQTSKGISFLEVKYQVMLQYLLELSYIVHLKISGQSLEGKPVVASLVELRVVLDKMKPIEAKLKYQIDKLVRAAVVDSTAVAAKPEQTMTETIQADPLAFKPNPMNLLNKADDQDEDEEEEGDSGVYRPPKLAPVSYDDRAFAGGKKERDEARLKEKQSRSRLMKDLMTEMSDRPEEVDVFGGVNEGTGYGDKIDSLISEKNKYEEENYVRLAVTRKEKLRMNKNRKMRFESEFDNLNDFSNLGALKDVEEKENERYRNVLERKKQKSEIYQSSNKRTRDEDNDNDDNFNGLFDGERKPKNRFSSKRAKGGKPKKKRS